jgi:hypothetical protein
MQRDEFTFCAFIRTTADSLLLNGCFPKVFCEDMPQGCIPVSASLSIEAGRAVAMIWCWDAFNLWVKASPSPELVPVIRITFFSVISIT